MLIFPQLSTGASAQYPIVKRRSERTILNLSEDGRITTLGDPNAKQLHWDLTFEGLTDQEMLGIAAFFQLCEGPLQPFLFLDATQNLFAYSEDYTQPAWVYNPLLTLTTGIDDPFGTNRASRLTNTSQAVLTITQTVGVPGSVECALSAYLRSGPGMTVADSVPMTRTDGSTIAIQTVQPDGLWQRFSLSTLFASSISTSCDFSIGVPSGASLDLFGLQVDAQPLPGKYVQSTSETGVFPEARFESNSVSVISTGPGQSSLKVSVMSKASE